MREHLIGKWAELMKYALTDMSEVALMLGTLVEVADGVGNREHLGFLDASLSSPSSGDGSSECGSN